MTAGLVVAPMQTDSAVAASASDWDPGYIIDDAVFYDGNAMTDRDIQSFLNSRVSSCASGFTCLKDYSQATGNIAGDQYCNGYAGSGSETAAQIIDKVARSCGISQRALLVLLEKEQGLVSSRSPGSWAYRAATGMGCPDTAACDASLAGFFYQVYYGARQFEVYRLYPGSFRHQPQRTNQVRLSPNADCGSKSVFIYNSATAGLYNYTPYTPDDAALGNLYGVGGACSSYGNRNFWRLFTDWFGNPRTYTVLEGFQSYWNSRGGASGAMGSPISYAVYVEENGQGWYQRFQGGTVYGSFRGGTVFVANNVILAEYNRQGGPYGSMSWPNGEQYCAAGSRCAQSFVGATMTTSAQYGAKALWGGFRDYWTANGGLRGALGAALNDLTYSAPAAGAAYQQNFESGVLVQGPGGFQLMPYSRILDAWSAQGGGAGGVGWPIAGYECAQGSCAQRFTGGVLGSTPWYGVQTVSGAFATEYVARGGLTGALGAPFGPVRSSGGATPGAAQNFAAGILAQSGAGFKLVPYGPSQAIWSASGENRGYGWPTTERVCDARGCVQEFSGGVLSDSPWGAYATFGGLAQKWKTESGATVIGPAINDVRFTTAQGGGWAQHYTSGIITQPVSTGEPVFSPYGRIIDMWYYYGAEYTWLGWPVAPQTCQAGACTQQFQNGVARSTPDGSVSFSRQ